MKEYINAGVRQYGDDFSEAVFDLTELIAPDHRWLLNFDRDNAAEKLTDNVRAYMRGEYDRKEINDSIRKLHPFLDDRYVADAYIDATMLAVLIHENSGMSLSDVTEATKKLLSSTSYEWLNDDMAFENFKLGIEGGDSEGIDGKDSLFEFISLKKMLKRKITLLLDDTDPDLAKLTKNERVGLYTALFGDGKFYMPHISYETEGSLGTASALLDFDEDYAINLYKETDRFVDDPGKGIPDKLLDIVRTGGLDSQCKTYYVSDLKDLFDLEIWLMLENKDHIKRCKSCGRFFVQHGDEEYCGYPDENGSSCLTRARHADRQGRMRFLYRNAYRTHMARLRAGHETKESIDAWRRKAAEWKKAAIEGKITEDEYRDKLMEKTE